LIIAPNLTIKKVLYDAMDITNRRKCFWRVANVLKDSDMTAGPLACTLDSGNVSVAKKSHIVITNIHQLATNVEKWLNEFPDKFFDMIIIDEAHHSAASSWKKVLARFPEAKVVHMTATPFRSDRQEIDGVLVYRYPFRSATLKGYIKRLKASYVAPSEVELSFSDSSGKIYTLDEVLKLKEEDWFSRSIALSKPCNEHIVDSSLEKLEELRQTGTKHQLVAVACTINHAREIRSMYQERNFKADIIHSEQSPDERAQVLQDLENGSLDCIVQVRMLGEGFDHPKLSVAAIFNPFRTLAPYIQFVGRIMRVIVQRNSTHPDNMGHIVTHLGMNLDKRLEEFKLFEKDDQRFWENVIGGEDPEIPRRVQEGRERLTVGESSIVVNNEIVDSLWEEDFTSLEDEHVIEELKERFVALGLNPDLAESVVKEKKQPALRKRTPTEPFPIQPQRKWQEARKRLHEQVNRTANILLNNTGLEVGGTEIPYKYTGLNISARNNLVAAIMMVNKEVNDLIGKERPDWSTEEYKTAIDSLEDILNKLVRKVKKTQSEYEKAKR
jgi:superfamily II DNA or RNA helicase